ncbi:MAG: YcxB family protein [Oscillospiraceae bacterium]|jgi:hypothetical protein|nr:YcxB family protein [Oscillospiraceae bacterium]
MENIKFENVYEITPKLLKSWHGPKKKRIGRYRYVIIWLLLAGVALFLTGLTIFGILETGTPGGAVALIGGIYLLIMAWIVCAYLRFAHRMIKKHLKTHKVEKWYQTIQFDEENIIIKTDNISGTYSYKLLKYVEECEDCFFLWIDTKQVYAVLKGSFTKGNAEEFMAFVREKGNLWSRAKLKRRVFVKNLPLIILFAYLFILCVVNGILMPLSGLLGW